MNGEISKEAQDETRVEDNGETRVEMKVEKSGYGSRRNDSRRGSISIFLVVVFACFITVTAVLFAGAKSASGRSMADASLQLAGRSVLSEYDRRLMSDYGLLAFRGDEKRIEDAIVYYSEASLAPKDPLYRLFRSGNARTFSQDTRCKDVNVSLATYSLLDLDNFEDQVRNAALPEIGGSLLVKDREGGSAKNKTGREDGYGRVLRNKSVISSLPSRGFDGPLFPSFGDLSDIPNIEDVLQTGTALFMTTEYAIAVFGNHVDGAKEGHFFGNEIEYLIAGRYDDKANYSGVTGVKIRLIAIRNGMNHVALMKDPEKMARVEALAAAIALITGESAYEAAKFGVIEAWVAAETGNDLMLLEQGEEINFIKTPAQWATQNIVEIWGGWTSTKAVHPIEGGGQNYSFYLRLMLYLLDRETKLLRMMDLMQLNLKGTYYEDFLMREYYTGFRFDCVVDGEKYAYTEKY